MSNEQKRMPSMCLKSQEEPKEGEFFPPEAVTRAAALYKKLYGKSITETRDDRNN